MKELKRIVAFVLCFVMVATAVCFAANTTAAAVEEKLVNIVSPSDKNITTSDSLLVSVKINKTATIKISVYEEKIENKKIVTSIVSGTAVTREAISYSSVDTSKIEEKDLATTSALSGYTDVKYSEPTYYTSKDNLELYTAQINDVKPGVYKVVVETIEKKTEKDAAGKEKTVETVVEKTQSVVVVKEKPAEDKTFTTTKEKSSALTKISNFFKSLFK